jgi:predicted DNA-binding WGR domain protein
MGDIRVTGYYLENTNPGHSKFYLVTVADNGVLTLTWGRIGTNGQSKVQKFPSREDADTVGMRQVYAKAAKGYTRKLDDVRFSLTEADLDRACTSSSAATVNYAFWRAGYEPQFEADKTSVLRHYEDFLAKAQGVMDKAATLPFDAVLPDFEELEESWAVIEEAHATTKTTLDLTRQKLRQSLMSGGVSA